MKKALVSMLLVSALAVSMVGCGAKTEENVSELFHKVIPQDMVKFGLIPEFIGRVPVTVALDLLDEDALVDILTKPKNALVKQYRKLFAYEEVDLDITEEAARAVAKKSLEQKTGARGLRTIMENALMDVMYTIPSDDSIARCIITEEVVNDNAKPVLEYRTENIDKKPVTHKIEKNDGESA